MMRNDLTPYVGVLILILLEYGLRPENIKILTIKDSLNPYSIGIWSATSKYKYQKVMKLISLNPYSIGIWSATQKLQAIDLQTLKT